MGVQGATYGETHDRCATLGPRRPRRAAAGRHPVPGARGARARRRTPARSRCCTASRGRATSPSPGTSSPAGSVGLPANDVLSGLTKLVGDTNKVRVWWRDPHQLAGVHAAHHGRDGPRARGEPDAALGLRVQERDVGTRRRSAAARHRRPAAQRARPPGAVGCSLRGGQPAAGPADRRPGRAGAAAAPGRPAGEHRSRRRVRRPGHRPAGAGAAVRARRQDAVGDLTVPGPVDRDAVLLGARVLPAARRAPAQRRRRRPRRRRQPVRLPGAAEDPGRAARSAPARRAGARGRRRLRPGADAAAGRPAVGPERGPGPRGPRAGRRAPARSTPGCWSRHRRCGCCWPTPSPTAARWLLAGTVTRTALVAAPTSSPRTGRG